MLLILLNMYVRGKYWGFNLLQLHKYCPKKQWVHAAWTPSMYVTQVLCYYIIHLVSISMYSNFHSLSHDGWYSHLTLTWHIHMKLCIFVWPKIYIYDRSCGAFIRTLSTCRKVSELNKRNLDSTIFCICVFTWVMGM